MKVTLTKLYDLNGNMHENTSTQKITYFFGSTVGNGWVRIIVYGDFSHPRVIAAIPKQAALT